MLSPTMEPSLLSGTAALLRYDLQNLEDKRPNLRLCARSLSLQELYARSRELEITGRRVRSVLQLRARAWRRTESAGRMLRRVRRSERTAKEPPITWLRLSKNRHYLTDNIYNKILSDLDKAVKQRAGRVSGSVWLLFRRPSSRTPRFPQRGGGSGVKYFKTHYRRPGWVREGRWKMERVMQCCRFRANPPGHRLTKEKAKPQEFSP
jgi:hypothetical protein